MTTPQPISNRFLALVTAVYFSVSGVVSQDGGDVVFRIRGGTRAPEGRFPYMGSLQDENDEHSCGAVLIEPEWVVTAAHCVHPESRDSIGSSPIFVLGDENVKNRFNPRGTEVERVAMTFIHPNYVNGDIENGFDIAILKLPRPYNRTPIALADPSYKLLTRVAMVLGWGDEGANVVSEGPLKMANVPAMEYGVCKKRFFKQLKPTMVCAFSNMANTCFGDSGGPLIVPHEPHFDLKRGKPRLDLLVGIVSFGVGDCSSSDMPGVFTNVASFHQWIKNVISGKSPSIPHGRMVEPSRMQAIRERYEGKSQKELDKALHDASESNDPDVVEVLIRLGANTESTKDWYETPLHEAAKKGSLAATKVLLRNGANFDAKNVNDWTPLHFASNNGRLSVAKVLIKNGATVDAKSKAGRTALHLAADKGHLNVVKELLRRDADVNAQNTFGNTPLHIASLKGRVNIAKVLLENWADKTTKNKIGETAKDVIGKWNIFLSRKDRKELKSMLG